MESNEIQPPSTPNQRESLITAQEREDDQLLLLIAGEVPKVDRSAPEFDYTGDRLFRDRPDIYRAVVHMLAEPGASVRQIKRICHVSHGTIEAVAEREQIPISTLKKVALRKIGFGLRLATERVIEEIPKADAKTAVIAVGVLTEKLQLLTGEPTSRPDMSSPKGNIFDRLNEMHGQLAAMANGEPKRIEGKVIETGSRAENTPANALPAPAPDLGTVVPAPVDHATEVYSQPQKPERLAQGESDSPQGDK